MSTKKEVRLKRLGMLYEMMLNHKQLFKDVEFNICLWIDKQNNRYQQNKCGTAACALGSACLYPPFRKMGLRYDADQIPYFRNHREFAAGAVFFGISEDEAKWLFMSARYGIQPDAIFPRMVARRIKHLIKLYEKDTDALDREKTLALSRFGITEYEIKNQWGARG